MNGVNSSIPNITYYVKGHTLRNISVSDIKDDETNYIERYFVSDKAVTWENSVFSIFRYYIGDGVNRLELELTFK